MSKHVFAAAAVATVVWLTGSAAVAAPQYDYGYGQDRYGDSRYDDRHYDDDRYYDDRYGDPRHDERYGYGRTVRCDSNDNRYRRCAADTRGGVQVLRQYSKSACIEGRTWGYERGAVWVSSGCRAEFALGRGGGNGGDWGERDTVRCDSNDNRYRQCPIDGRRAFLVRQYSKSPCIEGRSWGSGRGFVWVSNGCRGEFSSRGGGHWGGGGWNQEPGWGQAQTLYCGSDDHRQRRCNVSIRHDARLLRQVSKAACIEGRTWGWDRGGVWVSDGCRGQFQVQ